MNMKIDDPFAPRKAGKWVDAAILAGIIIAGIGGIFVYLAFNPGYAPADAAAPPVSAEDACYDDWHHCTDNAMLVNHWKGEYDAARACEQAADDQAKFGHPTFSEVPFPTFHQGNSYVTSGQMILIDKGAAFQNGFGAMERVDVVCQYDLQAAKVTDFGAVPHGD